MLTVGINSRKEKGEHRRSKFLIMSSLETPIVDTLRRFTLACKDVHRFQNRKGAILIKIPCSVDSQLLSVKPSVS